MNRNPNSGERFENQSRDHRMFDAGVNETAYRMNFNGQFNTIHNNQQTGKIACHTHAHTHAHTRQNYNLPCVFFRGLREQVCGVSADGSRDLFGWMAVVDSTCVCCTAVLIVV